MKRHAFTLVELLVVIAIVGLLSTVAVVASNSARQQSRNVKRIADIKQLVTAFNLGLDTNGSYPASSGWACISSSCSGVWAGYAAQGGVDSFFQPFMVSKPVDPPDGGFRTFGGYMYNVSYGGRPAIIYTLESSVSCGVGYSIASASNYVECVVIL